MEENGNEMKENWYEMKEKIKPPTKTEERKIMQDLNINFGEARNAARKKNKIWWVVWKNKQRKVHERKIRFRELRGGKTEKKRNEKQKEMQSNIQNSKKAIVTK